MSLEEDHRDHKENPKKRLPLKIKCEDLNH